VDVRCLTVRQPCEPLELPVNGVIPGCVETLQLMSVGDSGKSRLSQASWPYGTYPKPVIPPNSILLFEMELLGYSRRRVNKPVE